MCNRIWGILSAILKRDTLLIVHIPSSHFSSSNRTSRIPHVSNRDNSNTRKFKTMTLNFRWDGQVIPCNNVLVPHGFGTKTFNNGDVQTGVFVYGQANGRGSYQCPNGDYYKGNYTNDYPDGDGESYQTKNQRRYKGTFRMGFENGSGVIVIGDGVNCQYYKRYEGEVRNGRRHGRGKLYLKQLDGEIASLEGNWANDVLNGPGTQISPTGQCFKGNFVNGFLEGEGTCKNADDGKTYDVTFTRGVVSTWKKSH
jgi:hypothetical protein